MSHTHAACPPMGSKRKYPPTSITICSLWGSNPRPMAHKTIALATELRERRFNFRHIGCSMAAVRSGTRGLVMLRPRIGFGVCCTLRRGWFLVICARRPYVGPWPAHPGHGDAHGIAHHACIWLRAPIGAALARLTQRPPSSSLGRFGMVPRFAPRARKAHGSIPGKESVAWWGVSNSGWPAVCHSGRGGTASEVPAQGVGNLCRWRLPRAKAGALRRAAPAL